MYQAEKANCHVVCSCCQGPACAGAALDGRPPVAAAKVSVPAAWGRVMGLIADVHRGRHATKGGPFQPTGRKAVRAFLCGGSKRQVAL